MASVIWFDYALIQFRPSSTLKASPLPKIAVLPLFLGAGRLTRTPVLPSLVNLRLYLKGLSEPTSNMKSKNKKLTLSLAAACAPLLPLTLIFAQGHAPTAEIHGIAVANIDTSVQPGDDFFHYANGQFLRRTHPPRRFTASPSPTLIRPYSRATISSITPMASSSSARRSLPTAPAWACLPGWPT